MPAQRAARAYSGHAALDWGLGTRIPRAGRTFYRPDRAHLPPLLLSTPRSFMGESAAFELQDVSRRYGRRWALARLSFTLQRGSSLLLTGHNGSGKTTLLK